MSDVSSAGAPVEALCQDCLRVVGRAADRPANDGLTEPRCACGGEACSCSSCQETLRLLRAGELDAGRLGLISPIAAWSETEGWS